MNCVNLIFLLKFCVEYKSSGQANNSSGSSSNLQMLSSTPSRSAFLQSLQRSRERSTTAGGDALNQPKSSFTPRRLSLSPAAELKPVVNTPSLQSKLASHAYTLSRSSEEDSGSSRDSLMNDFEALKREIERDKRRESFYLSGGRGSSNERPERPERLESERPERDSKERFERSSNEPFQKGTNERFERSSNEGSFSSRHETPIRNEIAPNRSSRNESSTSSGSASLPSSFSFNTSIQPSQTPQRTPVQPLPIEPSFSLLESSRRAPMPSEVDLNDDRYRPSRRYQAINYLPDSTPVVGNEASLKQIIQAEVLASFSALRNDLQNLQVELIKQSLAQQATMRSLFETYLPMTGQLMDALTTAREENERLKLLLSDKRK